MRPQASPSTRPSAVSNRAQWANAMLRVARSAGMTAHNAEKLRYQDEDVAMCTNPLSDYFAMGGANPRFKSNCTALWRGCVRLESEFDVGQLCIWSSCTAPWKIGLPPIFPDFPGQSFRPLGLRHDPHPAGQAAGVRSHGLRQLSPLGAWRRQAHPSTQQRDGGSENAPEGYEVGAVTRCSWRRGRRGGRIMYLYWYLGVGAAVLAIVFGARRLTKDMSRNRFESPMW